MNLLLFDNYDSFTFNLLHLLEKVSDCNIEVYRNDQISISDIDRFDKIVISPGPGLPSEAGLLAEMLKVFSRTKTILGVCLGHQAIAESFGGELINLDSVFHGTSTPINIIGKDPLFNGLAKRFNVGRYHSWIVNSENLPDCFEVTAVDDNKNIMAMRHKKLNISSVQFHPESILSEYGEAILKNWLLS